MSSQSSIPRYSIDLSLPPSERWRSIVDRYANDWRSMEKELWKSLAADIENDGEGEGEGDEESDDEEEEIQRIGLLSNISLLL